MATLQPGEKSRMYALGGIARGGAFRGGYVDNRIYINIDGDQIGSAPDDDAHGVLLGTLTITDILDETPNTCSFRVNGYVPDDGAELIITRGSKHAAPLFAGYALTVQQLYAGVPRNVQADVRAVDYTWLLGMQKVTGQFRNQSATAIVQYLVSLFAAVNGFTTHNVAAGLPGLDVITFTDEDLPDAITRICRRIGAYWYVDYLKDVHVFFEDTSRTPPAPLVPTHPSLTNFTRLHERTQGLTRVYVEGRGSTLLAAVNVGETILPMAAVDMFTAAADTFLKVSVQGADSALHLNFSGVVPSPGGSLVGPGVTPSSGPIVTPIASGTGMEPGTHDYAYSWVTASGETRPSPATRIATENPYPAATVVPSVVVVPATGFNGTGSVWPIGESVRFALGYGYGAPDDLTAAELGPIGPPSGAVTTIGNSEPTYPERSAPIEVTVPRATTGTPLPTYVLIYASRNGGPFLLWASSFNEFAGSFLASTRYVTPTSAGSMPAQATSSRQMTVTAIAVGPTGTTARKVYRSAANQTTLKLLTTLANNTATALAAPDAASDTTLGAPAPAADTSLLPQPTGQVNPGATEVPVASTAPFRSAGGWASVGEQVIRYTGLAAGGLTGVPASGSGAIDGPIAYNTAISAAPLLTGIPASGTRALPHPLTAGDEVYAVVQVDDLARQAQLAADLNVASGIREEWVQDRRLSMPEARARGQATLLSRPLVDATVEYTCRDTRTASGSTIHVALPAPTAVTGDYKIQSVTWLNFRPRPAQPPTAQVTASSRRFSFEDLLRIVKTKE